MLFIFYEQSHKNGFLFKITEIHIISTGNERVPDSI